MRTLSLDVLRSVYLELATPELFMSNELFVDEVEPDWTDKDAKRWLEALGYDAEFAAQQHN